MARSRIALVAVALTLLVAASCSNDDDGGGSASKDTGGTASGSSTTAPARDAFNQAYRDGEPQQGGSIAVGVEAEIASLDPAGALAQVSDYDIAFAIYDPLVDLDDDGNLAPSLATEWSGSDDLQTWTLTLRDDVTFSDGTPFDADAVVKQFERLKDPATACVCASEVALDLVGHGRGRRHGRVHPRRAQRVLRLLPHRRDRAHRLAGGHREVRRRLRPQPGGHRTVRPRQLRADRPREEP